MYERSGKQLQNPTWAWLRRALPVIVGVAVLGALGCSPCCAIDELTTQPMDEKAMARLWEEVYPLNDGDRSAALRQAEEQLASCQPAAAAFLVSKLTSGKSADTAVALSFFFNGVPLGNDPKAVAVLIKLMKDNEELSFRAGQVLSNVKVTDAAVVEEVAKLVKDPKPERRQAAIVALTGIAGDKQSTVQTALKMLKEDKEFEVRAAAACALTRCLGDEKDETIPKALVAAMLTDRNSEVRGFAAAMAESLKKWPDIAVDGLLKALDDKDEYTRKTALWSLGRFGPKAAKGIPKIVELMKDPKLGHEAGDALARIGLPAVSALGERLRKGSHDEARLAAWALVDITRDSDKAIAELIAGLQDEKDYVRSVSLFGLGKLGGRAWEHAPAVVQMLHTEENDRLREYAALTIGAFYWGDRTYLGGLVVSLARDKSARVRGMSAVAIGRVIGNIRGELDALVTSLNQDESPRVRSDCATILGDIGVREETILHCLRLATKDTDEGVRKAATEALQRLEGKQSASQPSSSSKPGK